MITKKVRSKRGYPPREVIVSSGKQSDLAGAFATPKKRLEHISDVSTQLLRTKLQDNQINTDEMSDVQVRMEYMCRYSMWFEVIA